MNYIRKGTIEFYKSTLGLFFAGLGTFALLYTTQPLLPELSREFNITPAVASLSLSTATLSLAISMLFSGSISEVKGRKPIMIFSLFTASVIGIIIGFAPSFESLVLLRIFQGIAFAGLPSVAMAYLSEEIEPSSLGLAMGLYISGNSVGGMTGRILAGVLTDFYNWRIAMIGIAAFSLLASFIFILTLPPSRNFKPRKPDISNLARSMLDHLKNPRLLCLFGIAFLVFGSLVALFNYISYLLLSPPYNLSQTIVGWIFIVYLLGTFSSTWMGRLADVYGQFKVISMAISLMALGAMLTLHSYLAFKVIGIAVMTFGFFGCHSIASSWVTRLANHNKAQASSLYLLFYYSGSSFGGTFGGVFWLKWGWSGVIGMIMFFLTFAYSLVLCLISTKAIREIRY